MKLFLFLGLGAILVVQCKTAQKSAANRNETKGSNKVITKGESIDRSEDTQDKVIFEGENNTVYLEYLDSFFNSQGSRDVIFIEGDGNVFRLTHQNVIDNSVNSADTIHLKGDQNHVDYLIAYYIDNSKSNSSKMELFEKDKFKIIDVGNAVAFDSSSIENKITSEWIPVQQAYYFYQAESVKGNMDASFYLGEMYQLGVGTDLDIEKAEYYYLIAAKKGHKGAQASLGYIYENEWENFSQDLEKAKYWYRKAADQGDEYSKQQLLLLN